MEIYRTDFFEVRRLTENDYSMAPDCFAERDAGAEMLLNAHYGMLFKEGEEKPDYYFRHMNADGYRWGGMIHLGDGPLSPQTGAHYHDLAQRGTVVKPYGPVAGKPGCYRISSAAPFTEFTYSEQGATFKEGDIVDLKVEYFPYAVVTHQKGNVALPYWHRHILWSGIYEEKQVRGLACNDRIFYPKNDNRLDSDLNYFLAAYSGIREDGRKESLFAQLKGENGYGIGFYYIEGETPVISTEVYLEAKWQHLPYLPEDPTVVYTEGIWRFAGREFHFQGKWGSKGFTPTPRLDRIGQSHCFGTWYEGSVPYSHTLWHTFNENMEATDERIKSMGFDVL